MFFCLSSNSSGKFSGPNGIVGLPYHVAQGSGLSSKLRGQNCYVEVTLGCHDKMAEQNVQSPNNFCQPHVDSTAVRGTQKELSEKMAFCDKMFVYPAEAVLVPVMQSSFARSSLKRYYFII